MKVPFLDLPREHAPLLPALRAAADAVIAESAFSGGRFVSRFELEYSSFCQSRYAVGVGSGTDALWIALLAVGVSAGDEVITVSSSFVATVEAITHCGARPVFIDINEKTCTMDPSLIEAAITPRTRAIVPVHLFGQPADMDPILAIARQHGLAVVEDACQAHGARYKGRHVGTLGDAGCFSFYPGKNLGAFGEAGAVITGREDVANYVRLYRDHGQRAKYDHVLDGWNARMDGLQAAVLSVKLPGLAAWNDRRRRLADDYRRLLADLPVILPAPIPETESACHLFAIRVARRDTVLASLADAGIQCGVHYPVPIHRLPPFASLGVPAGALPVSERCAAEFLSLPLYPSLTHEAVAAVAGAVRSSVTGQGRPVSLAA